MSAFHYERIFSSRGLRVGAGRPEYGAPSLGRMKSKENIQMGEVRPKGSRSSRQSRSQSRYRPRGLHPQGQGRGLLQFYSAISNPFVTFPSLINGLAFQLLTASVRFRIRTFTNSKRAARFRVSSPMRGLHSTVARPQPHLPPTQSIPVVLHELCLRSLWCAVHENCSAYPSRQSLGAELHERFPRNNENCEVTTGARRDIIPA